jgi:hypothetical protein
LRTDPRYRHQQQKILGSEDVFARGKNLSTAALDVIGVLLYFMKSWIAFWASLIQIICMVRIRILLSTLEF